MKPKKATRRRGTTLTPRSAENFTDVCKLERDNVDLVEGWALIDFPIIVLTNQKTGEAPTGKVTFSRRSFNAIVDWYNGQKDPVR